jgi:hypothetical protein
MRWEGFARGSISFPRQGWGPNLALQSQKGQKERHLITLQAPRRSTTQKLTHDQSQVERCHVDQQTLENIRVAPQVHPSHPARFIQVREALTRLDRTANEHPANSAAAKPN